MVATTMTAMAFSMIVGRSTDEEASQLGAADEVPLSDPSRPFARFQFKYAERQWNLGEGEYFVTLLSTSCAHCAAAVEELNELALFFPDLPPIVGLCLGDDDELDQFREQNNPNFPTVLIPPLTFFDLIGSTPPRFVWVRDGKALQHWDGELPSDDQLLEIMAPASNAT